MLRAENPKIRLVELETEIDSVRERINDLEWRLSREEPDVSEDARTKAVTKLRYLMEELAGLRKAIVKREIMERSRGVGL